ncbi:putative pheromone-dependent cell cycle arrest protein far11 [Phaeomoniella chlamydospora]|uniref:Putative pheromone-dependent cell cycle arrest protein far11 n=1 Tax=Phaeomoniella chlamydospora TaxID=158046 RepID=A0A0G2E988_PHACM|nr:putative pheromone-dependent cell cycle arrest protein far11 [Phaeomoniella chlamydospora]
MAAPESLEPGLLNGDSILVKADEVDQTGTVLLGEGSAESTSVGEGAPTDSLSLPQLRQLVSQFPKVEQTAYAFQYADAQPFPEEVEEWFQYVDQERQMLLSSKEVFEQKWNNYCKSSAAARDRASLDDYEVSWLDAPQSIRKEFLYPILKETDHPDILVRIEAAEVIFYVLAGVWGWTAGLTPQQQQDEDSHDDEDRLIYSRVQLQWMQKGAALLDECSGIPLLFRYLQRLFSDTQSPPPEQQFAADEHDERVNEYAQQREITILMSSWYLIIEIARKQLDDGVVPHLRKAIICLKPNVLVFLVDVIASLRWNEQSNIPLTKLLLLFWKTLLLIFGGDNALQQTKNILQPKKDLFSADASHPILTASPLDYHFFRQEITSKYPAYNPPPPLIPLELEHKSILPPLPNHPSRANTAANAFGGMGPADTNTNSIFHQPVHIATPAPSPPPSPIGPGGKAGKKQNYQTNQNFPLLYPPLDNTSNEIGGKGSSNLQDTLVSKRWEGSDVPASIIEAGQLFASRMRMTRAMRQLWTERELSMKDDRGWLHQPKKLPGSESSITPDEQKKDVDGEDAPPGVADGGEKQTKSNVPVEDKEDHLEETNDPETNTRLRLIEDFYHESLPNMQSLIIVLLKTTLINVQAIASANGVPSSAVEPGQQNGLPYNKSNPNLAQTYSSMLLDGQISTDELDHIRLREICHKAISGTLMNVDEIIATKNDRDELGFFHFCHLNSDHPPLSPTSPLPEDDEASSPDEAAPPPILRHRRSPQADSGSRLGDFETPDHESASADDPTPAFFTDRPAVDELGNPIAPLPASPITVFSWRNFFTSINFLRILQKITRQKAHRCLLLVQYKSSTILRKNLKVPDPMLRLYTLKLFKSQVPYCGRKWRQSNMRVITAIYLHCRPELRDDWLAGMHDSNIEGEVDEALPLEQALRALTHWWHLRRYRDVMGANDEERLGTGEEMNDEEQDYFQRELNNMGWGLVGGTADDVAFGEDAEGRNGFAGSADEGFEAGGPLQMEGW